jgi:hypothetical protein
MSLLLLFFIPVIIGLAGFIWGDKKVTLKEFLTQEAVVVVVVLISWSVALGNKTHDVEIWNGKVADKTEEKSSCCHSYSCNPHSCMCDDDGCSTCYDTCYEHSSDVEWNADSSNGENVFHDGCNAPGTTPPQRWVDIKIGDPTSVEHSYENYLKASPDSILLTRGSRQDFTIPEYPQVFDLYNITRFIPVGVSDPKFAKWDILLDDLNADLGSKKQVNIIVIVVKESSLEWVESLKEKWIGGKKNDFIVVIGAPEYPKIQWVSVVSWSDSEDAKIAVRNRLLDLGVVDGEKIISIIHEEVASKFVRKEMKDFEFLKANIQPSSEAQEFIFVFTIILQLVLTYCARKYDWYDEEEKRW